MTKTKILIALSVITLLISSCSNKPNDETVKSLITEYQKGKAQKFKNNLYSPCGPWDLIEVPKQFKFVVIQNATDPNKFFRDQKDILEALSLNKVVVETKGNQTTDNFENYGTRVMTDYTYTLDTEGEKLKFGETGDAFVLNIFDITKVNILDKTYKGSDTLIVKYQLGETNVYKALDNVCSLKKDSYIKKDTLTLMLNYENKNWKFKQ